MVTGIKVIFNCQVDPDSMGGGDKIAIELARHWSRIGYPIRFLGCAEGRGMCEKNYLEADYVLISNFAVKKCGLVIAYGLRIIKGLITRLKVEEDSVIYSSSDFLPDTVPACVAKLTNRRVNWVCGFYLRALNPFRRETHLTLRSALYFFSQQITIILMKRWVNAILVLSDEDKLYLQSKGVRAAIKVISGGVDLALIESISESENKIYDGCFVGRFHEQKGLPNLLRSWKQVVMRKADAKLAIIGWGSSLFVEKLRQDILLQGLNDNVELLGFLDGQAKYEILKSSKVFVFPSVYESWGVVVIEAMACGLPVVAFDLPVLRRNFPKGLRCAPLGNDGAFADEILRLLNDRPSYEKERQDALDLATKSDWAIVAQETEQYLRTVHLLNI